MIAWPFRGSRSTETSKNFLRFTLLEALETGQCAFCHLAQDHARRAVDTLLNEAVIDVAQRDRWRQACGLCHWHAWVAVDVPQSAASLAILYQDVLSHDLRRFRQMTQDGMVTAPWHRRPRRIWRAGLQKWLRLWHTRERCPVCVRWQEQESVYLNVLLDDWDDAALAQAFAGSNGLCWPHLACLIAQGRDHAHLVEVLQVQQAISQTLHDDLQAFIRKLDYRFAHEPYGSEANAWQRVVALYNGARNWPGYSRESPPHPR